MNQANVDVISLLQRVVTKVEKSRAVPQLTRETRFSALGIDSVSVMEIIGEVEDELNITLSDDRLAKIQSVGDVEEVVLNRLREQQLH